MIILLRIAIIPIIPVAVRWAFRTDFAFKIGAQSCQSWPAPLVILPILPPTKIGKMGKKIGWRFPAQTTITKVINMTIEVYCCNDYSSYYYYYCFFLIVVVIVIILLVIVSVRILCLLLSYVCVHQLGWLPLLGPARYCPDLAVHVDGVEGPDSLIDGGGWF